MEFIQALPSNPIFVLALIVVFGWIWINPPKTVFWKKNVAATFGENSSKQHPACFMCNEGGDVCYEDAKRCAAMREDMKILDEIYKD